MKATYRPSAEIDGAVEGSDACDPRRPLADDVGVVVGRLCLGTRGRDVHARQRLADPVVDEQVLLAVRVARDEVRRLRPEGHEATVAADGRQVALPVGRLAARGAGERGGAAEHVAHEDAAVADADPGGEIPRPRVERHVASVVADGGMKAVAVGRLLPGAPTDQQGHLSRRRRRAAEHDGEGDDGAGSHERSRMSAASVDYNGGADYAIEAAVAIQPSRALGYMGDHPDAARKRALLTRTDRVSDVERSPSMSARRPGTRSHADFPAAAASASA